MFERVSDIMPPICSFLLQHTLLLLLDICAPLFHFLLIVYIASITISTSLNQVYLLKSTPLRLYVNLIAFNSLPLNTSIDWMNVRVSSRKRNLSNYCCFTIYIYIYIYLPSQSFARVILDLILSLLLVVDVTRWADYIVYILGGRMQL